MGRYIRFYLKSSFRDIQEHIVSVSKYCFRHFPNSWNFFSNLISPYHVVLRLFSSSVFLVFFPFLVEKMLIVLNCAYILLFFLVFCWKMTFLASYCFPFLPISRLKFRLVSHFLPISCLKFFLAFHFPVHFLYCIVSFSKNQSRPPLPPTHDPEGHAEIAQPRSPGGSLQAPNNLHPVLQQREANEREGPPREAAFTTPARQAPDARGNLGPMGGVRPRSELRGPLGTTRV